MVLTGADPAFCAGMDLKPWPPRLRAVQKERQRSPAQHFGMMPPHETPVIGAINGPTVTGGLELAHVLRLPDRLGAGPLRRHPRPGRRHARRRHDHPAAPAHRHRPGPAHELDRRLHRRRDGAATGAWSSRSSPTSRCCHGPASWPATIASIPSEHVRELRRMYDADRALWRARGLARPRPAWSRGVDGGALRPVAPGHRAREDRRPGPGPDHGTRRRRRREGLRGHGPAPQPARGRRPRASGWSASATTGCTWPRRCTTPWRSRSWSPSTPSASPSARASTLAFTRSPTLLAYAAWDLAKLSGGRFELGLGTQIRQNIEDRYAVPFGEDPIGRLRRLRRRGPGRLRLVRLRGRRPPTRARTTGSPACSPTSTPGPTRRRVAPPIYLGGVQRRACELAGAVADGFVSHPTNSNPRYLRETCLPALAEGARRRRAGPAADRVRDRDRDVASSPGPRSTPSWPSGSASAGSWPSCTRRRPTRRRWSSTAGPSVGPRLRDLIRHDRWDDLAGVLSDEVLDTLVPSGTFDELPDLLLRPLRRTGPGHRGLATAGRRATTTPSAPSWPRCSGLA